MVMSFSLVDVLKRMRAPKSAIAWARSFGSDFRSAWDTCPHPELMLPIAAGLGVPCWDIINAAVEIIRWHLDGQPMEELVEPALCVIESYICNQAEEKELVGVIGEMGVRALKNQDIPEIVSACGAVSHVGQAAILLEGGDVGQAQYCLSVAVVFAAQCRVESIAKKCGYDVPPDDRKRTVDLLLEWSAPTARTFIPFESVACGMLYIASGMASIDMVEEDFKA